MSMYDFDWRFDYHWVRDGIQWFTYGADRPNPAGIFDYNQVKLRTVRDKLAGVDKAAYLGHIVSHLLSAGMPPQEQVETLIRFVQGAMWHPPLEQPMEADAHRWAEYYAHEVKPRWTDFSDPALWPGTVTEAHELLELHEGRCGAQAQVLMQLCQAAGFPARVMQLHHHRVTEVHYDGAWHYCDADVFKHGVIIRRPDGTLPSLDWLIDPAHLFVADALPPDGVVYSREQLCDSNGVPVTGAVMASYMSGQTPYYCWYLGGPCEYPPSVPEVHEALVSGRSVQLSWEPSTDKDEESPSYHVDLFEEGRPSPLEIWRDLSAAQIETHGLEPGRYRWTVRAVDSHRRHNPDTWYYPAEGTFDVP